MSKTFLYNIFGIGKIPEPLSARIKEEGILLMDEGIKGSATFINFRSPGKFFSWKRRWFTASIAVTNIRLLALQYSKTIINIPLSDKHLNKIQFTLEKNNTFVITFDAALFHDDWSGKIEYRFKTMQAKAFMDKLQESTV